MGHGPLRCTPLPRTRGDSLPLIERPTGHCTFEVPEIDKGLLVARRVVGYANIADRGDFWLRRLVRFEARGLLLE